MIWQALLEQAVWLCLSESVCVASETVSTMVLTMATRVVLSMLACLPDPRPSTKLITLVLLLLLTAKLSITNTKTFDLQINLNVNDAQMIQLSTNRINPTCLNLMVQLPIRTVDGTNHLVDRHWIALEIAHGRWVIDDPLALGYVATQSACPTCFNRNSMDVLSSHNVVGYLLDCVCVSRPVLDLGLLQGDWVAPTTHELGRADTVSLSVATGACLAIFWIGTCFLSLLPITTNDLRCY